MISFYTYGNALKKQTQFSASIKLIHLQDPYHILSNQYNLNYTSAVYQVSSDSEENLLLFQPVLFFPRTAKGQNLLFYENRTLLSTLFFL